MSRGGGGGSGGGQGGVVLTWIRVIYALFGSVHVGVHNAVLFEPVVVLSVPHEGKRGWGWLTLCFLDLSCCFSLLLRLVYIISGLSSLLSLSSFSAMAILLVFIEP